jgi:hypothetical protein
MKKYMLSLFLLSSVLSAKIAPIDAITAAEAGDANAYDAGIAEAYQSIESTSKPYNNVVEATVADESVQPGFWARARDRLRNAGSAISNRARQTGSAISNRARQTGNAIRNRARQAGNAISYQARRVGNAIRNQASRAGAAIDRGVERTRSTIAQGLKRAGSAVKGSNVAVNNVSTQK